MKEVKPKKHFGQNFLKNKDILAKISSMISLKDSVVIEIGPGTGNLTEFILMQQPKKLICIEKDAELISVLKDRFATFNNIEIHNLDAENINLNQFTTESVNIISNLPYNLGTKILLNLNNQISQINQIVVMLQKEVTERIMAKKNTEEYGKISFLFQYLYDIKFKMSVSKNNFYPIPNVESGVIAMTKKNDLDIKVYQKMNEFLTLCFQSRRKQLNTILKNSQFKDILNKIDGEKRIEDFDYSEIIKLF